MRWPGWWSRRAAPLAADPAAFSVIVQSQALDGTGGRCLRFVGLPGAAPTRLLAVADPPSAGRRDELLDAIATRIGRLSEVRGEPCGGPGSPDCPPPCDPGLGFCYAVAQPEAWHVLLVVAGDGPPTPALNGVVVAWLARGREALGVFASAANPDVVLPVAIRHQHAPSWRSDVREVADDVVDTMLLGYEDRRVFISYSRADGRATAERVAKLLVSLRFDVFLDAYRLPPGADFVERIVDELVDKAMVVVIETPASVASGWVRTEVSIATAGRLGLAAVNLVGSPQIDEIGARCVTDDDGAIGRFVLAQHRSQLLLKRRSVLESVRMSLLQAGVASSRLRPTSDGYLVDVAQGVPYAVTVRSRPADLHRFRVAHQRAGEVKAQPVVIHPQPIRRDRRDDARWLSERADIVDVDEGSIAWAAARIASGTL